MKNAGALCQHVQPPSGVPLQPLQQLSCLAGPLISHTMVGILQPKPGINSENICSGNPSPPPADVASNTVLNSPTDQHPVLPARGADAKHEESRQFLLSIVCPNDNLTTCQQRPQQHLLRHHWHCLAAMPLAAGTEQHQPLVLGQQPAQANSTQY